MSFVWRCLCGLVVGGLVFAAGALALLCATPFGNRLVLDQSEQLAASALPPGIDLQIGNRSIGASPTGAVAMRFEDVVLTRQGDRQPLASIGKLSVGLSLPRLLGGGLAADAITAEHVSLDPSLLGGGSLSAPTVGEIFAALDRAGESLKRLPLDALAVRDVALAGDGRVGAPHVASLDVARTGTNSFSLAIAADLEKARVEAEGSAELSDEGAMQRLEIASRTSIPGMSEAEAPMPPVAVALTLDGAEGARRLRASTRTQLPTPSGERVDGDFAIEVKEGGEAAALAAQFSDGSVFDAAIEGRLDLGAAAAGILPFEVQSTKLVSSLSTQASGRPASAERAARFAAAGSLDLSTGAIRLVDASLKGATGAFEASASLSGFAPTDRLKATVRATSIAAEDLVAFWPPFVADGPRAWAMENLEAGNVSSGTIGIDLTVARLLEVVEPDVPLRGDEFELQLAFADGAFRTIDGMPELRGASGTIRHKGDHATVALETAAVDGMADIAVQPSSLDFQHAGDGTDAAVSLNVEGPAGDLLALAERQKAMAGAANDITPGDLSGTSRVGVGVAFHIAHRRDAATPPEIGQVKWTVVAELEGVDVKKPIDGRRLTDLSGTALIAEGSAMGDFAGKIDALPAKIAFAQPMGEHPVGESSLKISARLDDAAIARLAPALSTFVKGPVDAELTREANGFSASLDLSAATLRAPAIGWAKSGGIPGQLTFKLAQNGAVTTIRDAVLKGDGFSATGSAELDEKGLKSMVLTSLALNRDDSVSARVTRIEGGLGVSVAANSIDVRPILAAIEDKGSGKSGAAEAADRLVVELAADRLIGFGGETLEAASLRYEAAGSHVRQAVLGATIRGKQVSLDFAPSARETPALRLEAGDAGALLRFSGIYDKMRDGRLSVSLGTRGGAYAGRVLLTDFTLVDEERLRRLVGTARQNADGLAARLGKELPVANAYFDTARATLLWQSGTLEIDNGIVRGPVFGSSFSGTLVDPSGAVDMAGSFMPAYGVNRLFGALPFVGGVLGNGGEGGLIGITYRLEGKLADPTLIVNPISLIAPGIFRRIFEY
ncbi:hypothetical protein [Jiella sonneratiae]|uniref:DUF3971 domain-containing protein n=1 Tax=Jiella sonneratiae TaxID=2816856 RepID=A0ABS3IZB1_9HYPH|nr:hypothetical protein [Jiella sonneratiae]MBO0902063.1 hypothetical protein [Jiella sonneratiae]